MQDSEAESSPWDSPISSIREKAPMNEKVTGFRESVADSSLWDSDEEHPSKHSKASKHSGAQVTVHFIDSQLYMKKLEEPLVQRYPPTPPRATFPPNQVITGISKDDSVKTDSSSETQAVSSLQQDDSDIQSQAGESHRNIKKQNKDAKESSKDRLPTCVQPDSEKPASSKKNTGRWGKRRKRSDKPEAEDNHEKGQHDFALENTEPTGSCVISEENVVIGIMNDISSSKDDTHKYHFDHGQQCFFQARKEYNDAIMSNMADWVDDIIRQCWKELFVMLRILVNVVLMFVIELVNFVAHSIIRALVVGLLSAFGDHLLKPLLVSVFNSLLQPLIIFLLNLGVSLRTLLDPLIDIVRRLVLQVALLLRAFRLVDVHSRPATSYCWEV